MSLRVGHVTTELNKFDFDSEAAQAGPAGWPPSESISSGSRPSRRCTSRRHPGYFTGVCLPAQACRRASDSDCSLGTDSDFSPLTQADADSEWFIGGSGAGPRPGCHCAACHDTIIIAVTVTVESEAPAEPEVH